VKPPIKAAQQWRNNAELIADVASLYIRPTDKVIDPTYGRGLWWSIYRPSNLVIHDLYTLDGVDFRKLPYKDNEFDCSAYDPPYVSVGGKQTSTLGVKVNGGSDYHDRYGLINAPTTPAGLQELINEGLTECNRVTKRYVFIKVQDYVSSGNLWNGTYLTQKYAIEELGMTQIDRFEMVGSIRPQPPGRRQVHARRNLSTLFVFKKKRGK
jgi:tRNA G10  N-methylase Trm11